MTADQLANSLLAVPAFVPVLFCPGYVAAWATNLHDFRKRSLVERIFWSLPLSVAVSTISSVLIGKFLSLTAVVLFFWIATLLWIGLLLCEWLQRRRTGTHWTIGWRPLGGKALLLALLWVVGAILSLVDIQRDHQLFMNVALLDQSYRINWTESVIHTGVPPANPLYMYKHPAPMRNYYFWYVLCAAVAKMSHLSVRGIFNASCIWAGFAFAAIIGLYLKYFLAVGSRLRPQFLSSIALLAVTGLDIGVVLWNLFVFHIPPPADLEAWSRDGIVSWLHTLFWAPHHLVSMLCCMFAFLLAWRMNAASKRDRVATVVLIAFALSSAFGLSIYVTFAFFLVAATWAVWQAALEHRLRASIFLAAGGAGAVLLLIPYLHELIQSVSSAATHSTTGSAPLFSFSIRQMIPPQGLLAAHFLQPFAATHPVAALDLAKVLLLLPGYALELGFYFVVCLAYLIPAWRRRKPLAEAHRSLLFVAAATVPFMSFIRSGVLQTNDFAWRAALFVQFPLLLLASELIAAWKAADQKQDAPTATANLPGVTPQWLRVVASLALVIGVFSTVSQALLFRFLIPLGDMAAHSSANRNDRNLSQKAYISVAGFAALNKVIPPNAVVQFNPENLGKDRMAMIGDMVGIAHQTVIASDEGQCGAEVGGDPSGCPILATHIDQLYNGASAEQALATCRQLGIQYLVARVYDPIWKDKESWAWELPPIVSVNDFRALSCQ